MAELAAHLVGDVVVAGNEQDRHSEIAEQQVHRAIGRRIVVHDVAGQDDGVRGQEIPARMVQAGLQPRQGPGTAQGSSRIRQQVRVRELEQSCATGSHNLCCIIANPSAMQECPCPVIRSSSRMRSTIT
jgi:hypothetical protein